MLELRRGGTLPEAREHVGSFPCVGGHPQLDLVNTVSRRLAAARTVETLPDWTALLLWATSVGIIADRQGERFAADARRDASLAQTILEDVRRLRETSYRVLQPLATRNTPRRNDIRVLGARITEALADTSIATIVPLTWTARSTTIADLPGMLALSAWHLLATEDLTRLRQCADSECGWLFLDASKNLSRHWCSPLTCGNRARVRRHQDRIRGRRTV
ncbi:CGNR zinc finger domain-containing protein [Kribbella sancticallisti]|uniref:CGNR zinc finger domain-containing protein n=1 Tax=Kribbella sancticallisti TaxID=460087 RepID=A0ABP4PME5_9ACTN